MTIRKSHADLPRDRGGEPPDPNPRFVHLLVEEWAEHERANPRPKAFDTRIRHSDAGRCARALSYSIAGIPPSDPMDLAGHWVTGLGRLIHEEVQGAIQRAYPDAEVEVKCRVDEIDASGSADVRVDLPRDGGRYRIHIEIKSTGGYGYKMKVGDRGAPEGPSFEHKAQAALNATADEADELVIAYIATEAISKNQAAKKGLGEYERFCAEWSYRPDQFEPWAAQERARMQGILDLADEGLLAARKIPSPELPAGHEIVDPLSGAWQVQDRDGMVDVGSFWACGYCSFQSLCAQTRAGRVPVDEVRSLVQDPAA